MTAGMRLCLYGKLPARRDFIAHNVPGELLGPWEEWLQASLAASKHSLGLAWQERFLSAPLWRFRLGSRICGLPVIGVMMPSVDGVGRYFPLCLMAVGEEGEEFPPPAADPMTDWFTAAEDRLLAALQPDFAFDADRLLAGLVPPTPRPAPGPGPENQLSVLLARDIQELTAGMSWWWTIGGGDFPVCLYRHAGLPDPYRFAGFIGAAS